MLGLAEFGLKLGLELGLGKVRVGFGLKAGAETGAELERAGVGKSCAVLELEFRL